MTTIRSKQSICQNHRNRYMELQVLVGTSIFVSKKIIKFASKIKQCRSGLFYWKENNNLLDILACHVDNMIWGGNQYFKENIINNLKKNFGTREVQTFAILE